MIKSNLLLIHWKIGKVRANFLRHEGYLGAIGAFLHGCEAEMAETGDARSELASGKQRKKNCVMFAISVL